MANHGAVSADSLVRQGGAVVVSAHGLDALIALLRDQGFEVLGPGVCNGAIVFEEIRRIDDLPVGWRDDHEPGRYAVVDTGDETVFGWSVGPSSLKATFFPPSQDVWRASRRDGSVEVTSLDVPDESHRVAVFGARPCDVAALAILDGVLSDGAVPDPSYRSRRSRTFMVVAECTTPASTCFCSSMGTGPAIEGGFDLAITEVNGRGGHRFVIRIGSTEGAEIIAKVAHRAATDEDLAQRLDALDVATASFTRHVQTNGIAELLGANIEHPRWAEVARRCLSCANCTMVCPTCFCSDVTDSSDLAGDVLRRRTWASCFDLEHSYVHGGPVRASSSSRYRQWMTHKLSTWWDQFATSGCVGCGRCITWCPVGIDITEEVAAIRSTSGATRVPVPVSRHMS